MSPTTARATQEDYDRVNVEGSKALATEARDSGVRRFVHISSTAAMGVPHDAVATEESECFPSDPYQISKREAELTLLGLLGEGTTELIVLRPCLVVGAGKDAGELLRLFRLCQKGIFPVFGDALQSEKPLVSVKDLVRAMILASEYGRPGEIYLIHSGVGHQLGKILAAAGELLGNPRPYLKIPLPLARLVAWISTPIFGLLGRRAPLTPKRLSLFLASRKIDIARPNASCTTSRGIRTRWKSFAQLTSTTIASASSNDQSTKSSPRGRLPEFHTQKRGHRNRSPAN